MSEESRLRWRCRRGMRELDVLLIRYLDEIYPQANSQGQTGFTKLLELQDPDVFALLTRRSDSEDTDIQHVVETIRSTFSP